MWVSNNEMENKNDDELWTKLNKLSIKDYKENDEDEEVSPNFVKLKLIQNKFPHQNSNSNNEYNPRYNSDNLNKGNNKFMNFQTKKISRFNNDLNKNSNNCLNYDYKSENNVRPDNYTRNDNQLEIYVNFYLFFLGNK